MKPRTCVMQIRHLQFDEGCSVPRVASMHACGQPVPNSHAALICCRCLSVLSRNAVACAQSAQTLNGFLGGYTVLIANIANAQAQEARS